MARGSVAAWRMGRRDTRQATSDRRQVRWLRGLLFVVLFLGACATPTPSAPVVSTVAQGSYEQAQAAQRAGNLEEAIRLYGEVVAADVAFAPAYYERGNSYALMGDNTAALQNYDEAIRLNPDFADAYHSRGLAWLASNEAGFALNDFNRAIELRPDFADAYYNRGNAYFVLEQYEAALADYERHIALAPESPHSAELKAYIEQLRMAIGESGE